MFTCRERTFWMHEENTDADIKTDGGELKDRRDGAVLFYCIRERIVSDNH